MKLHGKVDNNNTTTTINKDGGGSIKSSHSEQLSPLSSTDLMNNNNNNNNLGMDIHEHKGRTTLPPMHHESQHQHHSLHPPIHW